MAVEIRPNGNLVVTLRLTLRPGRDDDLILLIRSAPRGSLAAMVREAMRSGVSAGAAVFLDAQEEQPLDMSGLGQEI